MKYTHPANENRLMSPPTPDEGRAVSEAERLDARMLWELMRETRFSLALIDPAAHLFVDATAGYAALFDLDPAEIEGVSVLGLYAPEMRPSIEAIHDAFARGTLQAVRGQGPLTRSNGATIELSGWSRRIEGISAGPLVVTAAVNMATDSPLADDLYWVDLAPHAFGLPNDWRSSSPKSEARAHQLEQHLWRIALELRTAGLMPTVGEDTVSLDAIKEFAELTGRQREIVARLAAGQRVKEIAEEMYLSPSTVRNHLTGVFRKFHVHSQLELITALKGGGVVQTPDPSAKWM
jgi:DNA-binding CsgD family transcriptional regulator